MGGKTPSRWNRLNRPLPRSRLHAWCWKTAVTCRMLSNLGSSSPPCSPFSASRASPHRTSGSLVVDENVQPHIATLEYDGRRFNVTCRVAFDGIEYVGRLWFADESWDDAGLPDRGAFPGRTREESLTLARRLTPQEILLRYRRALAEKRRFVGLRRATDEI